MTVKRYTIELPIESYNKLRQIADDERTSVADVLRKAAGLLVYIRSLKSEPGTHVFVERGSEKKELIIDLI